MLCAARANPSLSPAVRTTFVAFAVLVFGSGLLWMPAVVRPHWPWPIAPFNAAFLGGVYLTELVVALIVIATTRWAPARLVLPMSLAFTGVVSLATLRYLVRFDDHHAASYG